MVERRIWIPKRNVVYFGHITKFKLGKNLKYLCLYHIRSDFWTPDVSISYRNAEDSSTYGLLTSSLI